MKKGLGGFSMRHVFCVKGREEERLILRVCCSSLLENNAMLLLLNCGLNGA